jgi:hypothetical protein
MNAALLVASAVALATSALAAVPANAAIIITQPPCARCATITAASPAIVTVRTLDFNAPRPGAALVSFNGTMVCNYNQQNEGVFGADTQIMLSTETFPVDDGPGGNAHAHNVAGPGVFSFNLASNRVVPISAKGLKRFQFRIRRTSVPTGTACVVLNSTFSIVFSAIDLN